MNERSPERFSRGKFLRLCTRLALSLAGLLGLGGLIRYFSYRPDPGSPTTFSLGFAADFPTSGVLIRPDIPAVIYHSDAGFRAYSLVCTHLGCVPQWRSSENRFLCPCHGSSFHGPGESCGINYEGPAPRPLERLRIFVDDEGQVVVDTSRAFRWEKGQWEDAECKIMV